MITARSKIIHSSLQWTYICDGYRNKIRSIYKERLEANIIVTLQIENETGLSSTLLKIIEFYDIAFYISLLLITNAYYNL